MPEEAPPPVNASEPPAPTGAVEAGERLDEVIPRRDRPVQPVVGLGGSAGSLNALRAFFSAMPADSGLAFVVVVHLLPDRESNLAALLQGVTSMPVVQVREAVPVEANRVYVIPPGQQLSLADGRLRLSELNAERGPRVAVDLFFRTLADALGPQATAIVLSGADGDGAIGLKRLKERGGLTIAQEPGEAEQDGMPRAAVATGMVDWVLPVGQMPDRLLTYYRQEGRLRLPPEEPAQEEAAAAEPAGEAEAALRDVLSLLRARTGHDFSDYKRATVLRRLARRLQVNGLEELPAYLQFLRTHPGETGALLQDLLISVTNFFRDPEAFRALEAELPRLFAGKKATESARVWVAGCATGEEAYSLAMLLAEQASRLSAPPALQVFATDLDEAALRTAREGLYPETIAADVSEERLRRFFVKEQGRYRVSRALRETVLFAAHDLLKDAPFSHLGLVSCRNLLIYLNRTAQRRALELFYFALDPAGLLFLGNSESVDEQEGGLFKAVDKKHRLYARGVAPRPVVPVLSAGPSSLAHALEARRPRLTAGVEGPPAAGPSARAAGPPGGREWALSWGELHLKLREAWAPASVLIDQGDRIVHLSERAERYLRLGEGEATWELLRVAHPGLRRELRGALFRARQTGGPVEVKGVPVELADGRHAIDLHVRPTQDLAPGFALVAFEEPPQATAPAGEAAAEALTAGLTEPLVHQLEAELDALKLQQRATIEEYEASLEELKSSNEELQAINEELRAATEEVETGREELQSINEELSTVNQELKHKVDELGRANSDLQNLMAATDIATLFLDRELRIQRYTPAAVKLFSLIPSDLGRPLADLSHRLENDFVVAEAQRVLETLAPIEREQRSREGRWYLARLLPYRTPEDRIAGVALTFIDITARKEAEAALQESEARFRRLSESGVVGVAFFSLNGGILEANEAFLRMLGASREELRAGQVRWDRYTPEEWLGRTRQAVEELRASGRTAPYEKEFVRADGTRRWGLFGGALLADGETGIAIVLDVTARKRAEEALRASEARLRLIMESARDFAIFTLDGQNRISSWNPGAEALFGYPAQEALGQSGELIFTPEDRAARQPEQELETARREGRAQDERWHLRRDGRRFWASGVLTPLVDPEGQTTGFLKILRDRTEVHQAEQARRQAEQRFSLLARSVRDYAIFLLDPQGRITHWNEGAARVKGYSQAEALGRHISLFYPPEQIAAGTPERQLAEAAAQGRSHEENWRVRKGGQRFWAEELIVPLRDEASGALLGFAKICRDLSERKAAEDERARLLEAEQAARQAAEAADRAKDRFLAALSHELRTPLTPVQLALFNLQHEEQLSPAGRETVAMIGRNLEVERQLIDDLLDVSRIVHGKLELRPEPVDLHGCVRAALEVCRNALAAKGLQVNVALEAANPTVGGDAARLQQVFWNLLHNAAKFTPEGGAVRVRSRDLDGGGVVVAVSDTGVGIAPGLLAKVFDPFEQGDAEAARRQGGLGLGLAICQGIVQAHGGRIGAESAGPGRGATFTVELPAWPPELAPVPGAEREE